MAHRGVFGMFVCRVEFVGVEWEFVGEVGWDRVGEL